LSDCVPYHLRNNPYTGTFHASPGNYSNLHSTKRGSPAQSPTISPVVAPNSPLPVDGMLSLSLPGPQLAQPPNRVRAPVRTEDGRSSVPRSDASSVSPLSEPHSAPISPVSRLLSSEGSESLDLSHVGASLDVVLKATTTHSKLAHTSFTTIGRGRFVITTSDVM
jgi:hypothetical protein